GDERTAGMSGVDRGVGLDEVEAGGSHGERGALAAHDSERDGVLEAEGMAEGQHELADADAIGVGQREGGQALDAVELEQCEVDATVAADEDRKSTRLNSSHGSI